MGSDAVYGGLIAASGALALACVVIGAAALLFPDEPDGLAVCTNPATNERVDDGLCGDFDDEGHAVYPGGYSYMIFDNRSSSRYGGSIPAVGQKLPPAGTRGFIRTYPKGFEVGKGVAASGAPMKAAVSSSISRGGFGVKGASGGS